MVKRLFSKITKLKQFKEFRRLPRNILAREFFYFFACLFVALAILEVIFPNIVLAYFNLNYLVVLIIISGLIALIKD